MFDGTSDNLNRYRRTYYIEMGTNVEVSALQSHIDELNSIGSLETRRDTVTKACDWHIVKARPAMFYANTPSRASSRKLRTFSKN